MPRGVPSTFLTRTLGEIISENGLKTTSPRRDGEVCARDVFFFNAGERSHFPARKNTRALARGVPTYDRKPEMSAYGVTERPSRR